MAAVRWCATSQMEVPACPNQRAAGGHACHIQTVWAPAEHPFDPVPWASLRGAHHPIGDRRGCYGRAESELLGWAATTLDAPEAGSALTSWTRPGGTTGAEWLLATSFFEGCHRRHHPVAPSARPAAHGRMPKTGPRGASAARDWGRPSVELSLHELHHKRRGRRPPLGFPGPTNSLWQVRQ